MVSLYIFVILGLSLVAPAVAPHGWVRATVRYRLSDIFLFRPMTGFINPAFVVLMIRRIS